MAILQPIDLRIGNLVHKYKDEKEVISEITGYDLYVWQLNKKQWTEIEPIELTEEWLIKFGFEVNQGVYFNKRITDGYYIASNPDGFWIAIDETEDEDTGIYVPERAIQINVKHVHQLQNLYFALTGEELVIK